MDTLRIEISDKVKKQVKQTQDIYSWVYNGNNRDDEMVLNMADLAIDWVRKTNTNIGYWLSTTINNTPF
ncbi:MAG: hypothetical protein DRQ61_09830 [Gammaproteobacteria bacterium]|nr:MAG: hypothetical protein DRQ61_09830 [Gammaproteobacteria bacterium]HEC85831.1 hypothetical protein [Thioploca sp.]